MISFVPPGLRDEALHLWRTAFGDGEPAVRRFFKAYPPERYLLCDLWDGRIGAMAYLLPMPLRAGAVTVEGSYIYAVATAPDYRGKGLCTGLLEAAHRLLRGRGAAFSALVPADERLRRFYRDRGYGPGMPIRRVLVPAERVAGLGGEVPVRRLRAGCGAEYAAARRRAFGGGAFVDWTPEDLSFRIRETELLGGETLLLGSAQGDGAAAVYLEGEQARVAELALGGLDPAAALGAIARRLPAARRLLIFLPPRRPEEGEDYGEWYWYDKSLRDRAGIKSAYLNLALD